LQTDNGLRIDGVVQTNDQAEDDFNERDVVTVDSFDERINTTSDQLQNDCGITATVAVDVAQVLLVHVLEIILCVGEYNKLVSSCQFCDDISYVLYSKLTQAYPHMTH
jgi:hypothetical protein